MTDVQANLFKLRHGVNPQDIANIFLNGKDAAHGLVKELNEVDDLLRKGVISEVEGARMGREAIGRHAEAVAPPQELSKGRDWIKELVEGIAGANRHVLIEGESGSGKSFMTRNIAFQRAQRGEEVNVLDPHNPENWKGVKEVFTRDTAKDFAGMMLDTLRSREKENVEAKARGEAIDFKPITFALSDFAAVAKEFPKIKDVLQTVLTEGRKFNIAVLAETAGFNAEEIGAGTQAMRRNFAQKLQMNAPGPGQPERTARIGGETFATPDLSGTQNRYDPNIVRYRSTAPPEAPPPPARSKAGDIALGALDSMRGMLGGIGGPLVGAGLDAFTGMRKAQKQADDLNKLGDTAGAAAAQLTAFVPAIAATGVAFGALTSAIDASVQKYGEVSPEVAQAQANAEIMHTLGDIQRGQEHGADLARYVESQARMQEKFEEAKMKFLSKIMPIIEAIFEFLGDIMEAFGGLSVLAEQIVNPLNSIAGSAVESVAIQRDARFEDDRKKDPTSILFDDDDGTDRRGVRVPGL